MIPARIVALGGIFAVASLTACGGGNSVPPHSPATSNLAPYTGPAQLASFSWGKNLLKGAVAVGPANDQSSLSVQVLVNQRDPAGLLRYAHDVSDPSSGSYRRFLTPREIADRFGASAADYGAAAAYFEKYGMHVSGWPQRESLAVTGSVSSFERALNTTFEIYKSGDETFIAPAQTPHLTTAQPILQIVGLVHAAVETRYLMRAGNGNLRGYTPQQVQRAFDFTGAYHGGFSGSGIDVAVIGTGPISPADTTYYGNLFGLRMASVNQVDVTDQGVTTGLASGSPSPSPLPTGVAYPYSSGFQSPPPVTAPCGGGLPVCNPEDVEAQLDTETIASLAPASDVLFYLGYNPNDCYLMSGVSQGNTPCAAGQGVPAEGITLSDAEIQQVIGDDNADVVSLSYGLGELLGEAGLIFQDGYFTANGYGYGPIEFASMAAEGMAVFASSGDTGAFSCSQYFTFIGISPTTPCVSYPASDPSVVAVGGITAPLDDSGRVTTQMTAWGDQTTGGGDATYQNNVGSGGGLSTVFFAPSWQSKAGLNTLTRGYRGEPDLSMLADPNTAPTIVANAQFRPEVFAVGGTSLAAPQMAAMWALVLQACKADATCASKGSGSRPYRLGNPAPLFYAIYSNAKQYGSVFDDVVYGDNSALPPPSGSTPAPVAGGYQAGTGYDLVTGVGVPHAGALIHAVIVNEGSASSPALP